MLQILCDCTGTKSLVEIVEETRVQVTLLDEIITRADWTSHDYNVHFSLGLLNDGNSELEISIEVDGGQYRSLPDFRPNLYVSEYPDRDFTSFEGDARTDLAKKYAVRLKLAAGKRIYLANTVVRSLPALMKEFDFISSKSDVEKRVIGKTNRGNDLTGYIYGNRNLPTILVTSGFHPPEPDTLATQAIMKWLSGTLSAQVLESFCVAVVPLVNPDGYELGNQGANAAGINLYWHFAIERPGLCPEAWALWNFACSLKPIGYIDFHCYTFQTNKEAGPYVRPLGFYFGRVVRAAANDFYNKITAREKTVAVQGFPTYAPHTLGSMLAKRFNTITAAKYHLHLEEGADACCSRGLDVFVCLAESLLPILKDKRVTHRSLFNRLKCWFWEVWGGFIRPQIGLFRRGRFREIRFDRVGQDRP